MCMCMSPRALCGILISIILSIADDAIERVFENIYAAEKTIANNNCLVSSKIHEHADKSHIRQDR